MAEERTCDICLRPAEQHGPGIPLSNEPGYELYETCKVCGEYKITTGAAQLISRDYDSERYLLSAFCRRAKSPLRLDEERVQELVTSGQAFRHPAVKADELLLYLEGKSEERFAAEVETYHDSEYPNWFARDAEESTRLLIHLQSKNLIEYNSAPLANPTRVVLTMPGWERARELQEAGPQSKRAFIAMWGHPDMEKLCEEGFKPALRDTGWDPVCVNWNDDSDKIDDTIFSEILRCGLFVGDATGFRPSVFLEIGMALGLKRKWIFTCRKDWFDEERKDREGETYKRPFDTHAFRHIVWEEAKDLKQQIVRRICSMGWQHKDPPPGYLLDKGE